MIWNFKKIIFVFLTLSLVISYLPLQTVYPAFTNFQVVQTMWGYVDQSTYTPFDVSPGDVAVPFTIIILNSGSQAYTGINAFLQLETPFMNITGGKTSEGFYSGNVPVGHVATLQFILNVKPDASIGQYFATMNLEYQTSDAYASKYEELEVPILLAGRVELDVSIDPATLTPGSTNKLKVYIINTGIGTASKVSVSLNFPLGLTALGTDNQWDFPFILSGETIIVALNVIPHFDFSGSFLQVSVKVDYTDAYGTRRGISINLGVKVSTVMTIPLDVFVGGSGLQPGEVNELSFTMINNYAVTVNSLEAFLTLPSATIGTEPAIIVLGEDNRWYFESIESSQEITFTVKLVTSTNAAGTNHQLTLTTSYIDPFGILQNEPHTFGVRVLPASKTTFLVSIDDDRMVAGSFNEPTITITNIGEASMSDVIISLSFPTQPGVSSPIISSMSNRGYFDSIPPNQNVVFSPRIFFSLNSIDQTYESELAISFQDESGIDRVETRKLGFFVRGSIIFEFFDIQFIPKTVASGANITITGDLVNTGTARALYTTMTSMPSPIFKSIQDSEYLGEVSINVPVPFRIETTANADVTNGIYPLTLVFIAQDDYGREYTIEKNFDVTIKGKYTPSQNTSNPLLQTLYNILNISPYIIFAFFVVITVFIFLRRRKSNLKTALKSSIEKGLKNESN